MVNHSETEAFAQRLRRALDSAGVRASPTVVANEFNLRYWGRSVTPHTARNWLLGKSIPTQDKLQVLSEWLQVSPDELRFGTRSVSIRLKPSDFPVEAMSMADREMVRRYLDLSVSDKKTAREVVTALLQAGRLKKEP